MPAALAGVPLRVHGEHGRDIYDPHGENRKYLLLRRALGEFVIDGVETTIPLFSSLVTNADIMNGDYDIHWLERFLAEP